MLFIGLTAFSQTYEERLKLIHAQVLEKQQALSDSSDELDQLQHQLRQSARSLNEAKRNLEKSAANLSALQSKLTTLNKQADDLAKRHTENLALLASGLRSLQHDARNHRFGYLLSSDDWNDFERKAVYYGYFSRQRADKLSEISKQVSDLSAIRTALKEQERLLESERNKRQKILQKIELQRQKKKHAINALEGKIKREHIALTALEKDAMELQRLIEQLGELSASAQQFNTLRGRLPWPINKPIRTRHNNEKLPGVFLVADAETEVKSIHDGRVVFSDWFRSYGMLLIIDHGEGYMSLYANNEVLYKDVGDIVRGGERIAEVGSGGTSGDTGLYFEIRKFNKQLNPKLWCRS